MNTEQGSVVGTAKPGTPRDPKPVRVVKLLGRSHMHAAMFRRVMVGTVWVLACLFLFVNPTGLWPLIPFIAVTGWIELSNLMVVRQMRAELRQVLDQQ